MIIFNTNPFLKQMGITNLNKFLRNNCPDVYEKIHISEYGFKKIAIDISLYLCKFKSICGDRWITAFINLIACLRKNEVHCVFIYDGGAPPEKDLERKERAMQRQKMEDKVIKLEEALEKFDSEGSGTTRELDPILVELYKKNSDNTIQKRFLQKAETEIQVDMDVVRDAVKKMRSYILDIKPEDFQLTKNLFDILNVPYYVAPLEAETMCSDLCKRGLVDAVLSEDTDVLAYASPVFLSKINTADGTCIRIKYPDVIEKLELSSDSFLDLCIMCGTDYNKNIFRVGPEKAYKFIKKYQTIEDVGVKAKLDISVLKHIRVRELFRKYEQKKVKIPYCGVPDFKILNEFFFKHNINCSADGLKKAFINNTLIFEETDE